MPRSKKGRSPRARVGVRASFVEDVRGQVRWLRSHDYEERVSPLREAVDEARTLLASAPRAGTCLGIESGDELRKLVLRRLPYVVWYVVTEDDAVWLLRLFHIRQRRVRR